MHHTTASQTIGPFWHLLEDKTWSDLTRFGAPGEAITVQGRVFDGAGAPMTDACVELWQSNPEAFGRAATDKDGFFSFKTMKPEPVPGPGNSLQAPHLALTILARGLLIHLTTRIYFEGEELNASDPILDLVEASRRETLIAKEISNGVWNLDIHLQGEKETIFFEV